MKFVLGSALYLSEKPCCPVCKKVLDGVTPVNFEGKPKPGDFSACVYCGTTLRFSLGLRLEEVTKDDLRELLDKEPDTFEALRRIVSAANAMVRFRRRQKYKQN